MRAIVYCSNTGHTERYAKALSKCTGLQAYPLERAMKELPVDTHILFMTWVRAGSLVKCRAVSKRFLICGICAVALNTGVGQERVLRAQTGLSMEFPLFLLPGGYDASKLSWLDGMAMKLVLNQLNKRLAKKREPSEHERTMREVLTNGGDLYDEAALEPVTEWVQEYRLTRKKRKK